jgi:hypothetical protein
VCNPDISTIECKFCDNNVYPKLNKLFTGSVGGRRVRFSNSNFPFSNDPNAGKYTLAPCPSYPNIASTDSAIFTCSISPANSEIAPVARSVFRLRFNRINNTRELCNFAPTIAFACRTTDLAL